MQLRTKVLGTFAIIALLPLSSCGGGASRQAQPPSTPTVRVTSPTDGEHVRQQIRPEGIVAPRLPSEEDLWVMVMDQKSSKYFPQDGPADEFDNRWQSQVANVGEKSSTGGKWDVVVFVVNQPAQKWFQSQIKEGRSEGVPKSELPQGARETARVTVIR